MKIPTCLPCILLAFLHRVTGISFSKCSDGDMVVGRKRHICGIRAADMPFSNIVLENCWFQDRTLRKIICPSQERCKNAGNMQGRHAGIFVLY